MRFSPEVPTKKQPSHFSITFKYNTKEKVPMLIQVFFFFFLQTKSSIDQVNCYNWLGNCTIAIKNSVKYMQMFQQKQSLQ